MMRPDHDLGIRPLDCGCCSAVDDFSLNTLITENKRLRGEANRADAATAAVDRATALADLWDAWDAYARANHGETTEGPEHASALRKVLTGELDPKTLHPNVPTRTG